LSDANAEKWDGRYARGEHASEEPNPLLALSLDEFARGFFEGGARPRALDVACGAGRHALLLAARGFSVTAVDLSREGVRLTAERARARGLKVDARVADLEAGEFVVAPDSYEVVCDFYYLQRDLFAALRRGVVVGGLFVAAIHLEDAGHSDRPMNPDYLLAPGELRDEFRGWEILHYRETDADDPDAGRHTRRSAEIIARRTS
jgi:tellurite methyltransferase